MGKGLCYVGLSLLVVHAWGTHPGSPIDVSQTRVSVVVGPALVVLTMYDYRTHLSNKPSGNFGITRSIAEVHHTPRAAQRGGGGSTEGGSAFIGVEGGRQEFPGFTPYWQI